MSKQVTANMSSPTTSNGEKKSIFDASVPHDNSEFISKILERLMEQNPYDPKITTFLKRINIKYIDLIRILESCKCRELTLEDLQKMSKEELIDRIDISPENADIFRKACEHDIDEGMDTAAVAVAAAATSRAAASVGVEGSMDTVLVAVEAAFGVDIDGSMGTAPFAVAAVEEHITVIRHSKVNLENYEPLSTTPLREFANALGKNKLAYEFRNPKYAESSVVPEHGIHAIKIDYDNTLHCTGGQNSFLAACYTAFSYHYALTLSPSIIWLVIAAGLATHINQNAERLRKAFVDHEGTKTLSVRDDSLVMFSPENNWSNVLESFSEQIKDNIGYQIWEIFQSDFTTSTPIDKIAATITIMSATEKYFEYKVTTRCAIPVINLEGSTGDWESMKRKVNSFLEIDPELGWWVTPLSSMLDKFIEASQGNIDTDFWNNWFKYNNGSGGATISGTVNTLFPWIYNCDKELHQNGFVDWTIDKSKMWPDGPSSDNYPSSLSEVPFTWEYLGAQHNLTFAAGLMGMIHSPETGMKPVSGYAIYDKYAFKSDSSEKVEDNCFDDY